MTAQILSALSNGDIKGAAAFIAIFVFLWIQVRGLRKDVRGMRSELHVLNDTVKTSLAAGEKRFEEHEAKDKFFEARLTDLDGRLKDQTEQIYQLRLSLGGKIL